MNMNRTAPTIAPYAVAIGAVIGITEAIGVITSLGSVPGLSAL